jgi:hypothetical protein
MKRRKRALSLSFQGGPKAGRRHCANLQLNSRLFDLPQELRDEIWKHCLGGLKLGFVLQMGCFRQRTWGPPEEVKKFGLLSLPLTCRRA